MVFVGIILLVIGVIFVGTAIYTGIVENAAHKEYAWWGIMNLGLMSLFGGIGLLTDTYLLRGLFFIASFFCAGASYAFKLAEHLKLK